ncbi:MAG: PorP/SprF family type IX secretion system membrane protein [Prevotellaceae bacterium]|jgi:type IX secretion system PorP/SprF family membrane protein|nr:PorP/SprF family type IX secretion system membrane protein [Prevotellaceae bacterium]
MKKVKLLLAASLVSLAGIFAGRAQDPYMSLKNSMPMFFNPASAGDEQDTRVAVCYRNHYPASGNGFATYSAAFDTYFDRSNSGFGIMFSSDQLGSKAYSYNTLSLFYSYKIQTGESTSLRAGLEVNPYYGIFDPGSLSFPDMINPDGVTDPNSFPYDRLSSLGIDFGCGALFSSKAFEAGASVRHIGSGGKNVYWARPLRLFVQAEWHIPIFGGPVYRPRTGVSRYLENSLLTPLAFLNTQNGTTLWGVGAFYHFLNFEAGVYERHNTDFNAFTTSFRIAFFSDVMNIDYTFDLGYTGKNFRGLSTSSHEIGVVLKFSR